MSLFKTYNSLAVCEYCGSPQTEYNRLEVHNFNGESFIICEVCLIVDKLGREGKLGVRR